MNTSNRIMISFNKGLEEGFPVGSAGEVVAIDPDGTVWVDFDEGTPGVNTAQNPWPIGDYWEAGRVFVRAEH
jgi:hypothetical protein